MKIKIENIIPCSCVYKGCSEVTVYFSINGNIYSAFGIDINVDKGMFVDADVSHLKGNVTWEERFQKNNEKKKCLMKTGEGSYDGYGQIISINPVIADFGDIKLDIGNFTHDSRVIHEFIYEKVSRLDICIEKR